MVKHSLLLLILSAFLFSQDEELDLDAMWENTVWEEIQDVVDKAYEVERVTAVAGVRGAEAEDEAADVDVLTARARLQIYKQVSCSM